MKGGPDFVRESLLEVRGPHAPQSAKMRNPPIWNEVIPWEHPTMSRLGAAGPLEDCDKIVKTRQTVEPSISDCF